MSTTATWLLVTGFVLLTTGILLRVVVMMRSSDASPSDRPALHGRELIGQYRRMFPNSPALFITRGLLTCGIILLLAGLAVQFSH